MSEFARAVFIDCIEVRLKMNAQERIFKGCNPSISEKPGFSETYVVEFTWGQMQMRGEGGRPQPVPSMPEVTVTIQEDEPVISWQILPPADLESREDFEAVILQLVADVRQVTA